MKTKILLIIGIYFLSVFVATEIFTYYNEIRKTENLPEYLGNPNECWYKDANGNMIPCVIDSGDHKSQTFIIFSVIVSPTLIVAFVIIIGFSKNKKISSD